MRRHRRGGRLARIHRPSRRPGRSGGPALQRRIGRVRQLRGHGGGAVRGGLADQRAGRFPAREGGGPGHEARGTGGDLDAGGPPRAQGRRASRSLLFRQGSAAAAGGIDGAIALAPGHPRRPRRRRRRGGSAPHARAAQGQAGQLLRAARRRRRDRARPRPPGSVRLVLRGRGAPVRGGLVRPVSEAPSRRKWPRRLAWALAAILGLALASQVTRDLPVEQLKPAFANGASRFIDLDGMSVHYRDEGSGPPLVLLHGTGSSLHTWDAWTKALRGHFRVIRMDLPGFGLTGPNRDDDYRIAKYVEFLDAFRRRFGLEAFALAGNSLGGEIAWTYAVTHPRQVSALVLVDPAGYPIERPALVFRLAKVPGLAWFLTRLDPGPITAKTLRDAYADQRKVTMELVERYRMLALREGNRRAFVARASRRGEDRSAGVGKVRAPTLILWGAQDRLIPLAHAYRFEHAIAGARLIVY